MNLNYSDEQNMLREQVLKFCETSYDFIDREKILVSESICIDFPIFSIILLFINISQTLLSCLDVLSMIFAFLISIFIFWLILKVGFQFQRILKIKLDTISKNDYHLI